MLPRARPFAHSWNWYTPEKWPLVLVFDCTYTVAHIGDLTGGRI